jgi:hypothetical protein
VIGISDEHQLILALLSSAAEASLLTAKIVTHPAGAPAHHIMCVYFVMCSADHNSMRIAALTLAYA